MKKFLSVCLAIGLTFGITSIGHAEYYVKSGDTMSGIAKKYSMNLEDLKNLNPHITNPAMIYPNQYIVVRSSNTPKDLVDYAKSLQDVTAYVYGGQNEPYRTDCSGWVQYIYGKFGVNLPRVSRDQAHIGIPVTFKNLQPADLMFFSTRADKVITHVGIYMGDNYWISNLNTKESVDILSTWGKWTQENFLFGKRVL